MAETWHTAAAAADIDDMSPTACTVAGRAIAIYRVDGAYYATSNICTHEEAELSDGLIEGCEIECPFHFARFDIKTGKALTSPAEVDLATYPVREVDGRIEVCIAEG